MTDAWLKTIEATFERDFGLEGVRAEFAHGPIPHQAALTVYVPTEPTPAMRELARAIEAEWAELDKVLWVRVLRQRRPWGSWWARAVMPGAWRRANA